MRYLMTFGWIFFMRVLMADFESLKLVSLLMKCLCMAPLMPVIYGGNYILHLVAPHSSQIHLELGGGLEWQLS